MGHTVICKEVTDVPDKKEAWKKFEQTGHIAAYLQYCSLKDEQQKE